MFAEGGRAARKVSRPGAWKIQQVLAAITLGWKGRICTAGGKHRRRQRLRGERPKVNTECVPPLGGSEASLTKESNCVQMSSRSRVKFLSLEISLLDSISWTVRR